MKQDIKKILANIKAANDNTGKVKRKFSDWVKKLGIQEELLSSEEELWEDLFKVKNFPTPLTASGIDLSTDILKQSNNLSQNIDLNKFNSTLVNLGTVSAALGGVAISGASLSYPPNQLPQSYKNLVRLTDQQVQQADLFNMLKVINTALADEYNNAWKELYSGVNDPTRSPMFLMREVVTHLIHYYSPDTEVRKLFNLKPKDKIKRFQRIDFIVSKLTQNIKQTFINQQQALLHVYDALSKAHKPEKLNLDQTKGYLYQANTLIKLMLDCL